MNTAIFSTYLLPAILGLIMFNLGLSLTIKDFKRIFQFPKALIIGLFCQMVLLPLIAFGIAFFTDLSPAIKVGLVLIAVCPGGATSNLITYWLKGDVALAISITSINSMLIPLSIPGVTYLAMHIFLEKDTIIALPILETIGKIILMILLPTSIGLYTRFKKPEFSNTLEKYMKYITTILLAIIFTFTFFDSQKSTEGSFDLYWAVVLPTLMLNLAGMFSGYLMGRFTRLSKRKVISLVVEVGIQNSALAITIASSKAFLGNIEMAIPALVYGMFTFFNAILFGYIIKKWFYMKE